MKELLKGILMGAAVAGGALILAIVSEQETVDKTVTLVDPSTGEEKELVIGEETVIHFGKIDPERVKNFPKNAKDSIKRMARKMADKITGAYYTWVAFYETHRKEMVALKFGLSFIGVILGLLVKIRRSHDVFLPPKYSIDRYQPAEIRMISQLFVDYVSSEGSGEFYNSDGTMRVLCTAEAVA